ncbi:MAG: PIN domain-containing protein [Solirubrobacterales bacterium]|nr:PIN domain-containing protein [Solirubrobacterales bacterium]
MSLFVDTSVFFAAAYRPDHNNEAAKSVLGAGEDLVTTDHVLVETWLLLQRRAGAHVGERFFAHVRAGAARLEMVGLADLQAAWSIGETFPDQGFALVDRTSFAVMERLGVSRVATFDHHFAVYRFGPGRRHAFEVIS